MRAKGAMDPKMAMSRPHAGPEEILPAPSPVYLMLRLRPRRNLTKADTIQVRETLPIAPRQRVGQGAMCPPRHRRLSEAGHRRGLPWGAPGRGHPK